MFLKAGIVHVVLEKPASGELGFSLIGGEYGIFVKSISPGGVADIEGNLQVGDRLLKVTFLESGCFSIFISLDAMFLKTLLLLSISDGPLEHTKHICWILVSLINLPMYI